MQNQDFYALKYKNMFMYAFVEILKIIQHFSIVEFTFVLLLNDHHLHPLNCLSEFEFQSCTLYYNHEILKN
jgi:hypothetical protein